MTDGQVFSLQHGIAVVLRPLRRLGMPVCCVAAACLAGLLAGWLATSLMVPPAPAPAPVEAASTPDAAPDVSPMASAITVEPLAAPEPPPAPLFVSGPAHRPAELALLFFRLTVADAPAEQLPVEERTGQVRPGAPHTGSELALQWLARDRLVVVEPLRVLPGAPHRPAELYALLTAGSASQRQEVDTATLPGPPHTGSELALQWLQRDSLVAVQLPVLPGPPHRPGELYLLLTARNVMPEEGEAPAPAPGPPHTMPEVILLYGALATDEASQPPEIAMRTTWWLTLDNDNAALERARLAQERRASPEANAEAETEEGEVVITETGPAQPDTATALLQGESAGPPMIAIMIDDLGLNAARSARVADLPAPLTMAFMPYGEHLDEQTRLARERGHELFLHLPMEPIDSTVDPGPHALLENLDARQFATELAWNLDRFSGYVGVNNHMGSLLTQDAEAMALVMAELQRRDLLFVDSVTSASSVAYDSALARGIPAARRDVFLDNIPEVQAVLAQLDRLEDVARRQGFAIGIGHPHDATIAALAAWLPQAQARGIMLVPASRIIASRAMLLAQHAGQ